VSVDLSRMYESLGKMADAAALPGVETIRARARQRGVRTVGAALSAVLVLAVLAGTAFWLIPRSQTAVPPDIAPPATFLPFDPSAKPVLTTESGFDFGYAISRPGRAYVMWLDDKRVERVVAIDTTTGKPLWEPTVLGRFGDTNGMMVSRDAILMMTEQRFVNDGDPVGSDRLIAVDPSTGKVMWERDYSFNDTDRELYDDVLVITWEREGRTEAVDLKTGRPRWMVHERVIPGGTNAVRTHEEFRFTGVFDGPLPPRDRRIALQLEDGRVQVRDVDTGRLISERGGAGVQVAPDGFARPTVVDEKIHVADQRGVIEIGLAGNSPARVIFKPAGRVDGPIVPCGRTLICLLERPKGSFATDLVLIDTKLGQQLWRKPVGNDVRTLSPSGSAVLVTGRGTAKVFDLAGEQLWAGEESLAGWVDSGNLLVFGKDGIAGHALALKMMCAGTCGTRRSRRGSST